MTDQVMIDDADEVLNRQVHPQHWDATVGEPMWVAFGPQSSDKGLMSTLRGRVSAIEAYRRHTEDHGLKSCGTWGIRVGDATENGLACIDDGGTENVPDDHASVDFRPLTKAEKTIARRKLHEIACKRGTLYTPTAVPGAES